MPLWFRAFAILAAMVSLMGCAAARPVTTREGFLDAAEFGALAHVSGPVDAWPDEILAPGSPKLSAAPTTITVGRGSVIGPYADGRPFASQGAYTFALRVRNPGLRPLGLSLDGFQAAIDVACVPGDGSVAHASATHGRVGVVSADPAAEVAVRHGLVVALPVDPLVTCVLRGSNASSAHMYGPDSIVVGDLGVVAREYAERRLRAAVEVGAFFMFGFAHLVLFLLRRSDRAPLWFALTCFDVGLRVAIMDHWADFYAPPAIAASVSYRLEVLTMSFALGVLTGLFHSFLPSGLPKAYRAITYATSVVMTIATLACPIQHVFGWVLLALQLQILVAIAIGFAAVVRDLLFRRSVDVMLFAAGIVVLLAGGLWDLARAKDLVDGPWLTGEALIVTVAMQSFILARRNAAARAAAESLALELDVRNKDLAAANELKDQFLANTSHELRTPLNGIIGLADALLDGSGGEPTAAQQRSLGLIVQSGRRLANLVNDLLDFSKMKAADIELSIASIGVHGSVDLVCAMVQPLAAGRPLLVSNRVKLDAPCVLADEDRLQQILTNLLGNAVKFTRQGEVWVDAEVRDGMLAIAVHDTGVGIPEEARERIFEAFQQADGSTAREFGGTGLGLSVAKALVEKHGGALSVESTVGVGSVFRFTLPLSNRGPDRASQASVTSVTSATRTLVAPGEIEPAPVSVPISSLGATSSHRVLVVDDEPVNREVLAQQLGRFGHEILQAENGEEALALIEKHGKPDVLLLDVMMPKMSGYEVLERLRRRYDEKDLPVLLLTAKNREEDLVEGFRRGASDYLVKPFLKSELVARLEHHLRILDQARDIGELSLRLTEELEERRRLEGAIGGLRERAEAARRDLQAIEAQRTELRAALAEAEERLVHAEKMATIGTMVAGIAHDLNNPLHFIGAAQEGVGDLLADAGRCLDSEAKLGRVVLGSWSTLTEAYEFTQKGLERALAIGGAMRNMARADTDSGEVSLEEVARESLIICHHRLVGVRVEEDYGDAPLCWGRRSHLGQVLMNLAANAGDALREHAERVGAAFEPVLRIRTRGVFLGEDVGVELVVEDNGPGVPEAIRAKIFDATFTTKGAGKGTGLGLAICAKIVADHGGSLVVDASPELGGARFTLRVPGPKE
jgi:signal transduction histidine kinase